MLSWGALLNGFPMIFPDTGAYLAIAFGREYAIDRSSFYGLMLKPLVGLGSGSAGLWCAVVAQCIVASVIIWLVARQVVPTLRVRAYLAVGAALALFSSLPWHVGQLMPDALTGATVLLAWLAASRDPTAPGSLALWLAAGAAALTHYTHVPLLFATATVTIGILTTSGLTLQAAARRLVAALVTTGATIAVLVTANGLVLERWTMSPLGSAFLFARLTEDGTMKPWLRDACPDRAPADLCALAKNLPDDSQFLLWDGASPYATMVWSPPTEAARWRWAETLGTANRQAILARPGHFLAKSSAGAAHQFISFRALDDLCPFSCWSLNAGIAYTLSVYRPTTLPELKASRQVADTLPRAAIGWATTPLATLALLLLPFILWRAYRQKDSVLASLAAVVIVALVVNAGLAGALSDVHDRYQSRLVWLAPLVLVLALVRLQTFKRSRISLPGLK